MKMRKFFRMYILVPFIIMIAVFVILCILGYFGMLKNYDQAQQLVEQFKNMVESKNVLGEDGDISVVHLFLNNFQAAGVAAIIGFVPFLFLPCLILLSNGAVMGAMFAMLNKQGADLLSYFLAGILPHGIFEIPAICLGVTLGFQTCRFICCKILDRGKLNGIKAGTFFLNELKVFFFIATPLLIIAAIVETYVTPVLLNAVV